MIKINQEDQDVNGSESSNQGMLQRSDQAAQNSYSRNVYKTFQLEDQVIKNPLEYNQAIKVNIKWFCRHYVSDNPLIIQPSLTTSQ